MSDALVSCSRLIYQTLQKSQFDTWIDWERIPVGEKWWPEICQAIENATYSCS